MRKRSVWENGVDGSLEIGDGAELKDSQFNVQRSTFSCQLSAVSEGHERSRRDEGMSGIDEQSEFPVQRSTFNVQSSTFKVQPSAVSRQLSAKAPSGVEGPQALMETA